MGFSTLREMTIVKTMSFEDYLLTGYYYFLDESLQDKQRCCENILGNIFGQGKKTQNKSKLLNII